MSGSGEREQGKVIRWVCHSVLGTNGRNYDAIDMEREVLSSIAGKGNLFVYESERFWSQIKTAGYVNVAARHLHHMFHPPSLLSLPLPPFLPPPSLPSSSPSLPSPSSNAIYANRLYLSLFRQTHPQLLATGREDGPTIIGDVRIHPTASVDPSAVVSSPL